MVATEGLIREYEPSISSAARLDNHCEAGSAPMNEDRALLLGTFRASGTADPHPG
jgi:hypothetical protein